MSRSQFFQSRFAAHYDDVKFCLLNEGVTGEIHSECVEIARSNAYQDEKVILRQENVADLKQLALIMSRSVETTP